MSPEQDVEALLRRKRLSNIPKDQKSLLERNDSWAVDYKDKPRGNAQVPAHVLKTTKEAYMASSGLNKTNEQAYDELKSVSKDCSIPDRQDDGRQALEPSEASQDWRESSPERPLSSWSPSPRRPAPQPRAHVQSSVVQETPKTSPSPQFESQPLQTHIRNPFRGVDSEDSDEEDLEMAVPQAHQDVAAPVNMAAARLAMTATPLQDDDPSTKETSPPCAQPSQVVVIPGTSTKPARAAVAEAATNTVEPRRYRHKKIDFSSSPATNIEHQAPAPRRMPTIKTFSGVATSSHDTSSSSIVLESLQPSPAQGDALADIASRPGDSSSVAVVSALKQVLQQVIEASGAPSSSARSLQAGPVNTAAADASMQPSIEAEEALRHLARPSNAVRVNPLANEAARTWGPSPADSASLNPHQAFVAAYPDYVVCHGGTKWHFIQACVSLSFIKEKRMLREYLYDDFIRAFSASYKQYVSNARPGQQPLPAVEWFNLLRGAPQYSRMVVTMENLDAILSRYPEEIERAKSFLRVDDEAEGSRPSRPEVTSPAEPKLTVSPQPQKTPPVQRQAQTDGGNDRPRPPRAESRSARPASPTPAEQRPPSPAQTARAPSPQLGSEQRAVSSSAAPPPSSAPSAGAPKRAVPLRALAHRASRLSGSAKGAVPRKRAHEEDTELQRKQKMERLERMALYRRDRVPSSAQSVASGKARNK